MESKWFGKTLSGCVGAVLAAIIVAIIGPLLLRWITTVNISTNISNVPTSNTPASAQTTSVLSTAPPVPAGYELSPVSFSDGDEKFVTSGQIWVCRGPVTAKSGDILDGVAVTQDTFEKTVDGHTDDTYWGELTTAYPGADLLMQFGGSCKAFRADAPQNIIDTASANALNDEATTGCGSKCSSGVGRHIIKHA